MNAKDHTMSDKLYNVDNVVYLLHIGSLVLEMHETDVNLGVYK